jgi:hypothetical protein
VLLAGIATAIWIVLVVGPTDRHPAPGWQVRDCKAALRLVGTAEGTVSTKPKLCQPLSPRQYAGAVADVTRTARVSRETERGK